MPRADLHSHSRFSNKPTNFFLKRLKAAESMSEPEAIYAMAKRRGMDFVTITDMDSLDGCRQISHHEDVFTSCEIATMFPEDECMVRILVFGLNDAQLERIRALRGDVFSLRDYLLSEDLVHAAASPLEIFNSRLSPDHVEKLLLLFDHFETRSGSRHARSNDLITAILDRLTPEFMNGLQKKWGIEPASDKPWQKGYLGGSNDYCGQYVGLTWSEVPAAKTPREFLAALRDRESTPGGKHGSTLTAAHSMYRISFQYYQRHFSARNEKEPDLLGLIVSQVLQPSGEQRLTISQKLSVATLTVKRALHLAKRPSALERRLIREFIKAYREIPAAERLTGIAADDLETFDERLYHLADRVIGRVGYRLFTHAAKEFERGHIGNALSLGAAVLPLNSVLGPYLYAYDRLNRDRPLLADLESRFAPSLDLPRVRPAGKRIAWFSDTVTDVNGVSLTLHRMAEVAEQTGADLTIISSVVPDRAPKGSKFLNFPPVGELDVPDYNLQKLTVPCTLKMLRYLENAGFTEYVISTPGPVGLLAMLAAWLFRVPCRAIYHSDFPQHVRHITGDEGLEETTWAYMRWFYGLADAVYSPSDFYRRQLAEHGFDPERLFLFTRGTDLETFNPKHRDENFYRQWGVEGKVVFVYVGRVSREKNLDTLLRAFVSDPELKDKSALAIVGNGPYLDELRANYRNGSVVFPEFLRGKSLARAYASADVFVFPSMTDTYGNSVLEAQAAGLPALVSDEGGPKEIITPGESGLALPGYDVNAWRDAMRSLLLDTERRSRMAAAARARAATRDWPTAFREFWDEDPYAPTKPARRAKVLG